MLPHDTAEAGVAEIPWVVCGIACDIAASTVSAPSALADRRSRRLDALVLGAARDSPLYRRLLGEVNGPVALERLPVMHKAMLMRHFDAWVTDPDIRLRDLRDFLADDARIGRPFLGRYTVWQSSGSTGGPGVFVQDPMAMSIYDALEAVRRPPTLTRCFDPWFATERIAFIGATHGHFASVVAVRRARRLNPVLGPNLHEVSFLQPVSDLVAQLDELKPSIVCTYPSLAVLLAGERLAGHLRSSPREMWTGGETLTSAAREYIRQAFGCSVVNSYGASELLPLAAECGRGRLHLNADWAILEPVDDRGNAVPDDVMSSSCLLTNLANLVQPIIRYDLGDSVSRSSHRCACGSSLPVIDVLGRQDDILWLDDGQVHAGVPPLGVCGVLEDDAELFDFQLEQLAPASLRLSTRLSDGPARAKLQRGREALEAYFARLGCAHVRISIRTGTPGKRGAGGKVRRVLGMGRKPAD